jgi:hypothetical protein
VLLGTGSVLCLQAWIVDAASFTVGRAAQLVGMQLSVCTCISGRWLFLWWAGAAAVSPAQARAPPRDFGLASRAPDALPCWAWQDVSGGWPALCRPALCWSAATCAAALIWCAGPADWRVVGARARRDGGGRRHGSRGKRRRSVARSRLCCATAAAAGRAAGRPPSRSAGPCDEAQGCCCCCCRCLQCAAAAMSARRGSLVRSKPRRCAARGAWPGAPVWAYQVVLIGRRRAALGGIHQLCWLCGPSGAPRNPAAL